MNEQKPLTILIFDDDEDTLLCYRLLLEPKGFSIIDYSNPEKLLEDLKETDIDYDFALVDRAVIKNTRNIDGDYIMKQLKLRHKERKIISTSAYVSFCQYADYSFEKPFSINNLIDFLKQIYKEKV